MTRDWSAIHIILLLFLSSSTAFLRPAVPLSSTSVGFPVLSRTTPPRTHLRARLEIPRVELSSLTPQEFQTRFDHPDATPVVLTGIFEGLEGVCEEVVEGLGLLDLDYQIRSSETGLSEHLTGTLDDFIEECFQSSHDFSALLFDEQLLQNVPSVRSRLELPEGYFGKDMFRCFPDGLRPMDACLLMGGEGSRSTLHADPYEWVGYNILLEGSKLWTFADPSEGLGVDKCLEAYRLEPNAWQGHAMSAGWQSDVDLYRSKDGESKDEWVGAEQLGRMDPSNRQHALERAPQLSRRVFSASTVIDEGVRASGFYEVVQKEGDLVLIPPRWWHQTYHLEPTVAVASQYFNQRTQDRVFRHMLGWSRREGKQDVEAVLAEVYATCDSEEGRVELLLKRCLEGKLGAKKGLEAWDQLVSRHGVSKVGFDRVGK